MCLASNVFPEQLAPLGVSFEQRRTLMAYPIPTSATFCFKLIVYIVERDNDSSQGDPLAESDLRL